MAKEEKQDELWLEFVHPKYNLCSLCGNSGVIDTRGRAVSGAGIDAERQVYCICPNGRAYKKLGLFGKSLEG